MNQEPIKVDKERIYIESPLSKVIGIFSMTTFAQILNYRLRRDMRDSLLIGLRTYTRTLKWGRRLSCDK